MRQFQAWGVLLYSCSIGLRSISAPRLNIYVPVALRQQHFNPIIEVFVALCPLKVHLFLWLWCWMCSRPQGQKGALHRNGHDSWRCAGPVLQKTKYRGQAERPTLLTKAKEKDRWGTVCHIWLTIHTFCHTYYFTPYTICISKYMRKFPKLFLQCTRVHHTEVAAYTVRCALCIRYSICKCSMHILNQKYGHKNWQRIFLWGLKSFIVV